MDKAVEIDDYNSSEDEDYVLPKDAPAENENDAYLIEKDEKETKKTSEPTKNIDDLWSDFLNPTPSTVTKAPSPKEEKVVSGTKRKSEPAKSLGLDAALGLMKRSKKTSVLDKSQKDWNKFVKEKSMKEELDSHIKSQNSYLDKQEFLAKADYNQFVKEKASRDVARKPL